MMAQLFRFAKAFSPQRRRARAEATQRLLKQRERKRRQAPPVFLCESLRYLRASAVKVSSASFGQNSSAKTVTAITI